MRKSSLCLSRYGLSQIARLISIDLSRVRLVYVHRCIIHTVLTLPSSNSGSLQVGFRPQEGEANTRIPLGFA